MPLWEEGTHMAFKSIHACTYVCKYLCVCMCIMCAGACGAQEKASDPLKLELLRL